ncbi:MAG: hypothetical protein KGJ59_13610 [Bacteroidota bacterium]|nr:hypothetical protein [Bacteroidota bacterium]
MMRRPPLITIIGWLFIIAGAIGIVYHATEINFHNLLEIDLLLALVVRLLAVAGGIFLLRRASWARWLLVAWLIFHTVLSAFHQISELIMHSVLLAVVAFFLFRQTANLYFRGDKEELHL